MESPGVRVAVVGLGYFSAFQREAWARLPGATIVAVVDVDAPRAQAAAEQAGGGCAHYTSAKDMLAAMGDGIDLLDIVSPVATHLSLVRLACSAWAGAEGAKTIVCQKPLAPTIAESRELVATVKETAPGVRLCVHENWKFQPWYQEIKRLLTDGTLGQPQSLHFTMRTGDGRGPDAYARQPFFRDMERLLVFETGVHFIDTFRYLFGDEVQSVYALLTRHNPHIKGEDAALCVFKFRGGATATLDANRCAESDFPNPRLTFGTLRLDCEKGHLLLDGNAKMTIKLLEAEAVVHEYEVPSGSFAGDCVFALQRDILASVRSGEPFASEGDDYLTTCEVVEMVYESARLSQVLSTSDPASAALP